MTNYHSALASLSEDELYRYELIRVWAHQPGKVATFVMFNPSTADARLDDPTIRRCVGFAKREQCDGLKVVNLFAYRARKPEALLAATDPAGPKNDAYLRLAISFATQADWPLIVAWGALAERLTAGAERVAWFRREALHQKAKPLCLGTTKNGAPNHPLYLPKGTELKPWQ